MGGAGEELGGEHEENVEMEEAFVPPVQWRPVHPDPLILGVVVSDPNPEGIPVASGQEVPHKGLAGEALGGQRRTSFLCSVEVMPSPTCSSAVVMMARWPPLLLHWFPLSLQLRCVCDTM